MEEEKQINNNISSTKQDLKQDLHVQVLKRLSWTKQARTKALLHKTIATNPGVRSAISPKQRSNSFSKAYNNDRVRDIEQQNLQEQQHLHQQLITPSSINQQEDIYNSNNGNNNYTTTTATNNNNNDDIDNDKDDLHKFVYSDQIKFGKNKNKQQQCLFTSIELYKIHASTNRNFAKLRDLDGLLPLHHAINRSDANLLVVCRLLKEFPESAKVKDQDGYYPLFIACKQKKVHAGVIKALITAFPEAAFKKIGGNLALHVLALKGCLPSAEAVRILINSNPNAATTENNHGNLPLHYMCAQESSLDCSSVRIMLEAYEEGITTKNRVGMTPIDIARSRLEEQSKILEQKESELQERMRILLRSAPRKFLSITELSLLRDLNYLAKRNLFILSYLSSCNMKKSTSNTDLIIDQDSNNDNSNNDDVNDDDNNNGVKDKIKPKLDDFLTNLRLTQPGVFVNIASFM